MPWRLCRLLFSGLILSSAVVCSLDSSNDPSDLDDLTPTKHLWRRRLRDAVPCNATLNDGRPLSTVGPRMPSLSSSCILFRARGWSLRFWTLSGQGKTIRLFSSVTCTHDSGVCCAARVSLDARSTRYRRWTRLALDRQRRDVRRYVTLF